MSTPPQAKMGGNYLNSIIATQEAKRNGFEEAILLDHIGNVSEAPGENIFIVRNNQLLTPTLASSALEGITRDAIIKIAKDLDIDVIERDIPRSELIISDEIFLTGTAAEITPIISMDSKKIGNGKAGDITKKLMQEYTDIVMNKNVDYSHWLTEVYQLKIVQVGTGGWGKNHARILSQLGVLSAICDSDFQRSKECGEKYSVNHYKSLDELLSSEEFDGAFVVTP